MYEIDEQQIRQWWQVFKDGSKLVEIRLLGSNTYSGYFKDVNTLISALRPMLDHNNARYYGHLQAYFTLNDIDDDLYGREQHDKFVKKPKATTSDGNVIRRRFIMLDFDACRVAGVSANDQELEKAHMKAVEVYRYLMGQGFKEPIITTSGNGWHEYLTCDMPNDDEHNELVKNFLKSLGNMFSDEHVEIDEKVYNPARVDKMIGSWAKKGSDTQDRKWRIAKIVKVPQDLTPNKDELFKKIADLLPKEEPKQAPNRPNRQFGNGNAPFDLRTWLNAHGIIYKEETNGDGTKFVLEHCPWCDTHSNKQKWDSALFQNKDGQITFSCFHQHCRNKTWFDFRQFYEPDAYNKPQWQPQQYMPRSYVPQKPQYKIKDELPELGKKWLSMSDIEKVDLSAMERVKTGITEIDKKILGLTMTEVTLLSGGNGSGKSSLLNTLLCNFIQQGFKTALWSGELPAPILKTWIQMVAAGRRNLRPSNYGDGKYYVPNNVGERIDRWLDGKLFLFNNEYGAVWSEILHDMSELIKLGVKVFVLDNLFSLDIDLLEGDKNNKQKELILQIKEFAKKNQVHVILVAHPRKSMAFLRKNDISGSADLTNAVDNVWICHRVNQDFFRAGADFYGQTEIQRFQGYGTVIEICKNRLFGAVDVLVGMQYEIESRRFKNTMDENIHYGWEAEPTQSAMDFDSVKQQNENALAAKQPEPLLTGNWNYNEQSQAEINNMPFPPFGSQVDETPF